jgi:hypothetical protein
VEHNVANPTKCVVMGNAFVNSSVAQTQRPCVQDNALIVGGGNVAGMLPVNSSVPHTRHVVAMGLVVTLDRRVVRKMVCGPAFRMVIRTVICNVIHAHPVIIVV